MFGLSDFYKFENLQEIFVLQSLLTCNIIFNKKE